MLEQTHVQSTKQPLSIAGLCSAGFFIIALFFGTFGAWAALAPLQSAAIATGIVSVDSKRKTVQHLEGGIIGELRVAEGDRVNAGQTLIVLDKTRPQAEYDVAQNQLLANRALEARLVAERDQSEHIAFPDSVMAHTESHPENDLIHAQQQIFIARRESLSRHSEILNQRIKQFHSEIQGIKEQIRAQNKTVKLLKSESRDHQKLIKKGFAAKTKMLELQRELLETQGQLGKNKSSINRIEQNITEAKLQISELKTAQLKEVLDELRNTQSNIRGLQEKMRTLDDVLARTEIKAPITGTVVGLQVYTVGGVITRGEPLLDIVPKDEKLIIEAKVNPGDIDVVRAGQAAEVRFTSFNQRHTLPTAARVLTVSADHLADQRSGENYFLARVALEGEAPLKIDGKLVTAGMPAEVMIVSDARTPLDYLINPIKQSFNRALREDN